MKNMREIKFRAWDKKRQVMIGTDYPNNWENNKEEWYCDVDMMDIIGIENINNNDKFELMQFTGLLDKNGVDIYEGDIVKHREEEVGSLEVQMWEGVWIGMAWDTAYQPLWEPLSMVGKKGNERNQDLEVIGNIYSNPELLT